jgi:hypothetical protein
MRKIHKPQSEGKILPKNTADKEMASTMNNESLKFSKQQTTNFLKGKRI